MFQTVCRFLVHTSKNTEANFYWNRRVFRQCRQLPKNFHVKMTVPFTNGVSAERGTSRLRHRWHRLGLDLLITQTDRFSLPKHTEMRSNIKHIWTFDGYFTQITLKDIYPQHLPLQFTTVRTTVSVILIKLFHHLPRKC